MSRNYDTGPESRTPLDPVVICSGCRHVVICKELNVDNLDAYHDVQKHIFKAAGVFVPPTFFLQCRHTWTTR